MSRWLDWSRPRTWMLFGLVVAVVGVVVSASDDSGEVGRPLTIVGLVFVGIGFIAYLVTQFREGFEGKHDA